MFNDRLVWEGSLLPGKPELRSKFEYWSLSDCLGWERSLLPGKPERRSKFERTSSLLHPGTM